MPSSSLSDVRSLVPIVVPTAAVGAIIAAASAFVAGGKGAVGAGIGAALVVLFMGLGILALQRVAKSLPQLFQAMGMMLYVTQLLLLMVFMAVFKDTSLFNPRAFALSLVVCTVVWMAAQARAHMKAKIFYIDPEPEQGRPAGKVGSTT